MLPGTRTLYASHDCSSRAAIPPADTPLSLSPPPCDHSPDPSAVLPRALSALPTAASTTASSSDRGTGSPPAPPAGAGSADSSRSVMSRTPEEWSSESEYERGRKQRSQQRSHTSCSLSASLTHATRPEPYCACVMPTCARPAVGLLTPVNLDG